MCDTQPTRYFPWLPGRWTYRVVDIRIPVKDEFFIEPGRFGGVMKCANGYRDTKPKQIVVPLDRF